MFVCSLKTLQSQKKTKKKTSLYLLKCVGRSIKNGTVVRNACINGHVSYARLRESESTLFCYRWLIKPSIRPIVS